MNLTEQIVLNILKEGIFHIPTELPSDVDWESVYQEFKMQSLAAVAYPCVKKHISDESVLNKWKKTAVGQIYHWYTMMGEQDRIVSLLEENGYDVAVLKGNACAANYPDPQLRGSGDVDLLVRWEEYDEIYEFLQKQGYHLIGEKIETKHHFTVKEKRVLFEIHKRPGGTRINGTEAQTEMLKFFQDGLNQIHHIDCCGHSIPVLPPVQNAMVLLLHTAQHMREGIGLRHMLDWMLFADQYVNNAFWENELQTVAGKGEVEKLAISITAMCQDYLGLSQKLTWCHTGKSDVSEQLLTFVFDQGDFGQKAGQNDAETRVLTASNNVKGFLKRLNESSLYSMPKARKNKILRPAAWCYQLWRYVTKGMKKDRPLETLRKNMAEGKKRRELFDKIGLL